MTEIWITLEQRHIDFVDRLAHLHTSRRHGMKSNTSVPRDFETRLQSTIEGYRAEAAGRLWFGPKVHWSILDREPGSADFAGFVDAKNRTQEHHRLPITPDCPTEYAYLLVCGTHHPRYRIVAWCWGEEAKVDRLWDDPGTGRPAWWVKEGDPIMKDPMELLAIVRQHDQALA